MKVKEPEMKRKISKESEVKGVRSRRERNEEGRYRRNERKNEGGRAENIKGKPVEAEVRRQGV